MFHRASAFIVPHFSDFGIYRLPLGDDASLDLEIQQPPLWSVRNSAQERRKNADKGHECLGEYLPAKKNTSVVVQI